MAGNARKKTLMCKQPRHACLRCSCLKHASLDLLCKNYQYTSITYTCACVESPHCFAWIVCLKALCCKCDTFWDARSPRNAMERSIEPLGREQRKNLWIVFSFNFSKEVLEISQIFLHYVQCVSALDSAWIYSRLKAYDTSIWIKFRT